MRDSLTRDFTTGNMGTEPEPWIEVKPKKKHATRHDTSTGGRWIHKSIDNRIQDLVKHSKKDTRKPKGSRIQDLVEPSGLGTKMSRGRPKEEG